MSLPPDRFREQVTFATLVPAARLASRFGISLREMKQLVELACYREARRRGWKMKEIRAALSISMSKVGLLSKDLKERFAGMDPESAVVPSILSVLWAGPLSEVRLVNALVDFDEANVRAGLARLLSEGSVREVPGRTVRYEIGGNQHRLVRAPWMARIDALHDLMGTVVGAVEARFFDDDDRAFARALKFRVRPEDIPRLRALYEEQMFKLVVELDAAASDADDAVPFEFAVLWTPAEGGTEDEEDG